MTACGTERKKRLESSRGGLENWVAREQLSRRARKRERRLVAPRPLSCHILGRAYRKETDEERNGEEERSGIRRGGANRRGDERK